MPSLRQLLAAHAPLLLLDAASARIQVGWIAGRADETRWAESNEEAGVGVFRCLEELGVKPSEAGAFVFCDGPGSVLGIRTVAMAVRTWQISAPRPAFRYHSLALVAAAIGRPDVTVIADARRERWHACSIGSSLRRVSSAELNGPTIAPEGFRAWMPLPPNAERAPYSLAGMLTKVEEQDLFQPADEPDAFLHEEPNYATWTRQIHRAPFAL